MHRIICTSFQVHRYVDGCEYASDVMMLYKVVCSVIVIIQYNMVYLLHEYAPDSERFQQLTFIIQYSV